MSYSVYCSADFGAANTGKTMYGKLFDAAGSQVGATITTGFVEVTAGLYFYTLSAPDGHTGVFVMYDSANTALRRVAVVAPRETENSDVKTSAMATPANVTDAQTAITSAIAALNNLSQSQAQAAATAALNAYDPPTKAELDTAQSTIIAAVPGATVVADAVLGRSVAYVEDSAGIYSIAGLILAAFESSAPGTTWTIKKTDGTTTFATRTLTEDINAKPVTGVS